MLLPHQGRAVAAIEAAFRGEARSVRYRESPGLGGGMAAAAFMAGMLSGHADARCLVLCPRVVRRQVASEFARVAPGRASGEWGTGLPLEIATPVRAALRAGDRSAGWFDWILVEECHEPDHARVRAVVSHFSGARVLEVLRMRAPHPGILAVDADLDIATTPDSVAA